MLSSRGSHHGGGSLLFTQQDPPKNPLPLEVERERLRFVSFELTFFPELDEAEERTVAESGCGGRCGNREHTPCSRRLRGSESTRFDVSLEELCARRVGGAASPQRFTRAHLVGEADRSIVGTRRRELPA